MAGFLKCSCEHCGGLIEYPADAVGASVPCPHCQRETPLKLDDSGDDADVVAVGGSKARVVMGAVIASVVAVAVLAGALVWAKRKTAARDPSSPPPPSAQTAQKTGTASAPAASTSATAKVELDPPKAVVPVVAKFQNGLSASQIRVGREVIAGPCVDCHRQYDPATYGGEEWSRIIGSMRGKAKLKGRQSDELDAFVRSVRN
ncbi:MAG: hypothetical protein ACKODH_03310 [Limisphaerales bacterium]